jgi:hypothetical protein
MAPAARERELEARHARDRADDAQWKAGIRKRRPLLDVQLDEARGRWVEPAHTRQLTQPEGAEGLGERDAVGIDELALVVLEQAADRATAEHATAEARAFLEAECDHDDAALRRPAGGDRLGRVECAQDAESAVEAAAVRRCVQVRAAPDLRKLRLPPWQAPEEVAAGVASDVETRRAHPAADELVRALLARSQARSVRTRGPSDLEQLVQALENASCAPLRAGRASGARAVALEPAHADEYCSPRIL